MLPGRLGARFALEVLFLVLLAVGAGLADLRPAFIVLIMAGAWVLVALVELTAERIARSPVSYILPVEPEVEPEEEPERVFGPPVEERTVVAPPQSLEDTQEPLERVEPVAEAEPEPEPAPHVAPGPEPEPAEAEVVEQRSRRFALRRRRRHPEPLAEPQELSEPEPEPVDVAPAVAEGGSRNRLRSLLRRREPEPEPLPEPPPRHVKLLPRRQADEAEPAATELAEVFDADGADAEETAG